MKNVQIVKAGKGPGYFLTIGDNIVKNRWAVTALELLTLLKMLNGMEKKLQEELKQIQYWI